MKEPAPARPKFDYYILNTYQPEDDGPADRLYAAWLEQALLAEDLGYDTLWCTEHQSMTS